MNKITKFDRPACKYVAHEVLEAAVQALEHLGLTVKTKGGSFNDGVWALFFKTQLNLKAASP